MHVIIERGYMYICAATCKHSVIVLLLRCKRCVHVPSRRRGDDAKSEDSAEPLSHTRFDLLTGKLPKTTTRHEATNTQHHPPIPPHRQGTTHRVGDQKKDIGGRKG